MGDSSRRLFFLLTVSAALACAPACGGDDVASPDTTDGGSTACGADTPCGGDEVCQDGACVPLSSIDPDATGAPDEGTTPDTVTPGDDCVAGLVCVEGECVVLTGTEPVPVTDCAECVSNQCGMCLDCPSICAPDCSLKECGDDGCGGSCGTCDMAMECQSGTCEWLGDPLDPAVCTGNVLGPLQEFGGSCCSTATNHTNNPDCVYGSENYNDGACLDDQCEGGLFCSYRSYCSQGCTIYVDGSDNATGEGKPDGVQDTSIPDDCLSGAVDGPVGAEFHCVNVRAPDKDPYGICRPGTTFKECENDAGCPAGESCQALYILGEYSARCMTIPKGASDVGESCNSDPNAGPLVKCEGPFCNSGFGCYEFCEADTDCLTNTCEGGLCGGVEGATCASDEDCSAMYCRELTPYSDVSWTDDFCWPNKCRVAGECGDPNWFCRPFWNGASTAEEVALEPSCRPVEDPDNVAHYGEACGVEGDGTGFPPCVWSTGCIDNHCSGPCQSDADCSGQTECLLGAEWNLDVNDDEEVDVYLGIDLCISWPHSGALTNCNSDTDCPEGEHCEYRVKGQGDETLGQRTWEVEYVCRTNTQGQVSFGEECAWDGTADCNAELCLVPSGSDEVAPMCTAYCEQASDCPEYVEFDGYTWKTYCTSFTVAKNGTLDPVDDVFVPYCWRTSSVGSLEPCDENFKCAKPTNYCRALTIGGNPEEPVTVEHLCVDATTGLDAIPTKQVGEPCESWTECVGRHCASDGLGGGYCSELCGKDADCASETGIDGLVCTEQLLMPRPDPANSGITHRCFLQETCLPCEEDTDCGGDHLCMNMGALGTLADYRCGAPCATEDDCSDPEHSCLIDIGSTGAPTGKSACMPAVCE
jgi:hypothetical protein